jgi:spore maturation protein CgeB
MIKIIYSARLREDYKKTFNENSIEKLSNKEYKFTFFNHGKYLNTIGDAWTLDRLYTGKDENLFKTYKEFLNLIKDTDILIVVGDNVYHPEFLKTLPVYKVLIICDDPYASYGRTVPYLWVFDYVSCINVVYHGVKMVDKLKEWGAKRASWDAYGALDGFFNPNLTEEEIYTKDRPIDLLYMGNFYRGKSEKILEIKEHFGDKFKLYGNTWGLKFFGYYLLKGKWVWVKSLPDDKIVETHQKSKIGLSMHAWGELSNGRLYQLPANGIMQICDCKDWLYEVYEPNKEIVGYDTVPEAIQLIEYYLNHDEERKKIAVAGFKRAMKDYKYSTVMYNLLDKVKKGMIEDGKIL